MTLTSRANGTPGARSAAAAARPPLPPPPPPPPASARRCGVWARMYSSSPALMPGCLAVGGEVILMPPLYNYFL
jgi:hypothetical protein